MRSSEYGSNPYWWFIKFSSETSVCGNGLNVESKFCVKSNWYWGNVLCSTCVFLYVLNFAFSICYCQTIDGFPTK